MVMSRMLPSSVEERRSARRLTRERPMGGPSVPRREAGGKSLAREAVAGRPSDVRDVEVEAEIEEGRHHLSAGIAARARGIRQTLHALEQDVLSADLGRRVPRRIERLLDE